VPPSDPLDEVPAREFDTAPVDTGSRHPLDDPDGGHPASSLRSVLVEYPDRADRRTICPRGLQRHEVMVTWLTADADAFVDLLARR
jgi:hypothetical protein